MTDNYRIDDLGRVLAVTLSAFGAHSAMSKAQSAARAAGYLSPVAFRAYLLGDNPDPEAFPSDFEVLVKVKEETR
jgi:hypothetical protein